MDAPRFMDAPPAPVPVPVPPRVYGDEVLISLLKADLKALTFTGSHWPFHRSLPVVVDVRKKILCAREPAKYV